MDNTAKRLWDRLQMAFGIGRVTASQDDGPTQVLQLDFGASEIHDKRFRMAEWGFASRPLPGAEVLAAFLSGDRSAGVVIATGDRRYRLKNLIPGEVALYDDLGHVVKLSRTGITIDGGGHNITISNAPKVLVAGDIEVTGDVKAGTVSLRTHKHGGVAAGGAQTAVPTP